MCSRLLLTIEIRDGENNILLSQDWALAHLKILSIRFLITVGKCSDGSMSSIGCHLLLLFHWHGHGSEETEAGHPGQAKVRSIPALVRLLRAFLADMKLSVDLYIGPFQ